MWQTCLIIAAFVVLFVLVGYFIFGFNKVSIGVSALLGVLVGWLCSWRLLEKFYE
jgi:hypothetical protein